MPSDIIGEDLVRYDTSKGLNYAWAYSQNRWLGVLHQHMFLKSGGHLVPEAEGDGISTMQKTYVRAFAKNISITVMRFL